MTRNNVTTILITPMLLAAACGSSDDEATATTAAPTDTDSPTTTAAATTTEAPTTTAPAQTTTEAPSTTEATDSDDGFLPDSPATVVLSESYDFVGGAPDPALLPAAPGSIEATVYRTATTYAVVFAGLGLEVDACPGNSALTTNGFEFVSNAPLPDATCDSFPTLIENSATQGVQICGTQVSYLTLIPADTVGAIFVSLETPVDTGVNGVGISGSFNLPDPSVLPEIDAADLSC